MSEYISREAALEVFCRWCGICPKEKQKPLECDDILGNVLHSLPSADVRPVVRCRDCRHRDPEDHKCDCGQLERAGCVFPVDDDYYCAHGEKREEA